MSADKIRETQLRSKLLAMAKARWTPSRVMVDKNGRAEQPRKATGAHEFKHILIREDGWTIGATSALLEAAQQLWDEDWLGRVDFVNSECVEFHIRSTHGYWVSMGFVDIETGEPCALRTGLEELDREKPAGHSIEDLRDFMRKGMT